MSRELVRAIVIGFGLALGVWLAFLLLGALRTA